MQWTWGDCCNAKSSTVQNLNIEVDEGYFNQTGMNIDTYWIWDD